MTITTKPEDSFKVRVGDKVVEVDPLDFTRSEWRELRTALGLSQIEIITGVAQFDLDCVAGLVWLVLRRDDPDVSLDDIDLRISDIGNDQGATVPPA